MINTKAFSSFARERVQFGVHAVLAGMGYGLVNYHSPARNEGMQAVRRHKRERRMLLTPVEAYQIFSLVRNTLKLPGELAEVGVYMGASARMIHDAGDKRPLHLFDTFEGLPLPSPVDVTFQGGECCALYDEVLPYIANLDNVHIYPGIFPGTSGPVEDRRFSFVHLDIDLYEGTLGALEFFYPRMVPGGVILSHDYIVLEGVTKAFHEYFSGVQTPIIELPGAQCMVVKSS
jgi:O-methyltransferase